MKQFPIGRRSEYGFYYDKRELSLTDKTYFTEGLATRNKPRHSLECLFGAESKSIFDKQESVSKIIGVREAVYLTWENPGGASGGVLAVARALPAAMREAGEKITRVSPYHSGLKNKIDITKCPVVGSTLVEFDGKQVSVTVHKYTEPNGEEWMLVNAPGFFEADGGIHGTDPYAYKGESEQDRNGENSRLLRDSLFFCKAAPHVLSCIGLKKDVIVHAQDWQCASAALTINEAQIGPKAVLESAKVFITSHNPYDHYLPETKLKLITKRSAPDCWEEVHGQKRDTVYQRMVPLTSGPLTTVSRPYARELTNYPLLKDILAPHLQRIFEEQTVLGANNGDFLKNKPRAFTEEEIEQAKAGNYFPILASKALKKVKMLKIVNDYQPEDAFGRLRGPGGSDLENLPLSVPVFMMSGRLDRGQKGFDWLVAAIRKIPAGHAKFIISASTVADDEETRLQLENLQKLAYERDGDVIVYPFRMTENYLDIMAGVDGFIMCSRHEPSGGINEPMAMGTVPITRNTGGLITQVLDVRAYGPETGFGLTYEERPTRKMNIVQELRYIHDEIDMERLFDNSELYRIQVDALADTILYAAEIFRCKPKIYGMMLANLKQQVELLAWANRTVHEYGELYNCAA